MLGYGVGKNANYLPHLIMTVYVCSLIILLIAILHTYVVFSLNFARKFRMRWKFQSEKVEEPLKIFIQFFALSVKCKSQLNTHV